MQLQLRPRPLWEQTEGAAGAEGGMELAGSGGEGGGGGGGARRLVMLALRVAAGGAVVARAVARGAPSEAPPQHYGHAPPAYSATRREKPAYTEMIAAALLHMEEDGRCTMALGQGGGVSAAALKKYMHVHYPAASNAAALKTALKALVTKGSVLRVRASFRLSEAARAAARHRAAHGHLLPRRPAAEGGREGAPSAGQAAPKPPAAAPAVASAASAGSSNTYTASGGKRTEGGGYGYRAYGYAGSYGTRPGQPDPRPAAPAASSRAARLQSRPPPVLSGRRRYPG